VGLVRTWDVAQCGSYKNVRCGALWFLKETGMWRRVVLVKTWDVAQCGSCKNVDVAPCGSCKNLGCAAVWFL
jgi:hypothetical protein